MGTRAQLMVHGNDVAIYRHDHGRPDGEFGVLADLLPLLQKFKRCRGWIPDYLAAHISHRFIQLTQESLARLVAKRKESRPDFDARNYEDCGFLGHGVEAFTGHFHSDLANIYLITPDYVEVREPRSSKDDTKDFWANPILANTRRIKVVDYDGQPCRASAQFRFAPRAARRSHARTVIRVR